MTAAHEILDERDRMKGAFFGALMLHLAVLVGLVASQIVSSHTTTFGAKDAGGNVVGVQAVNTIPLVHHGAPNPLANDTQSEVPQTPVTKPKEQVKKEPDPPDAVKIRLKKEKTKPAEVAATRQRFRPLNELLPNQLTSQSAPQVSNQAFQVQGVGGLERVQTACLAIAAQDTRTSFGRLSHPTGERPTLMLKLRRWSSPPLSC